jgi:hypothetical protein
MERYYYFLNHSLQSPVDGITVHAKSGKPRKNQFHADRSTAKNCAEGLATNTAAERFDQIGQDPLVLSRNGESVFMVFYRVDEVTVA